MTNNGYINVADYFIGTRSLGPGIRAVIWVQGCRLSCPACIAPEWISQKTANLMKIEDLTSLIINNVDITGITISGGEPMLQAVELANLIISVRKYKWVNVICFTGFTYPGLLNSKLPGVHDFIKQLDVLIDGPYINQQNDGKGLRGSRNQKIIHLTNELIKFDFESSFRNVEVHFRTNDYLLIGIPPNGVLNSLSNVNELPNNYS